MIYFASGSDPVLKEAVRERNDIGIISTYGGNSSSSYDPETIFIADNGCFSQKWDEPGWKKYIKRQALSSLNNTIWAVCPDVIGDHSQTLALWPEHSEWIRSQGLIPAFVLQNGCETIEQVPDDATVLFIGGDTEYKLGPAPVRIISESPKTTWAHMGRVNSYKRLNYAKSIGCHSVDGTYISFGPKINTPKLCNWLDRVNGL